MDKTSLKYSNIVSPSKAVKKGSFNNGSTTKALTPSLS